MESSYATSNEMRISVAVGTAERGLSHPSSYLAWELFNIRVAALIMCCIRSISTVKHLCPSLAFPWSDLCFLPCLAAYARCFSGRLDPQQPVALSFPCGKLDVVEIAL